MSPALVDRRLRLAPFDTAVQPRGNISVSVQRALRSGWSKHGNASDARAGTNSE